MLKLFKRKKNLKERCREEYGDEFVELYEKLCSGEAIGDMIATGMFIDMVERVKKKGDWK